MKWTVSHLVDGKGEAHQDKESINRTGSLLSATPQCVKQNERGHSTHGQGLPLGSIPLDIILDVSEQSLFGQVSLRLDTSHLRDSKTFLYFYTCNQDVLYDWCDVFVCFCLPKSYEFEDVPIKGYLESKKY